MSSCLHLCLGYSSTVSVKKTVPKDTKLEASIVNTNTSDIQNVFTEQVLTQLSTLCIACALQITTLFTSALNLQSVTVCLICAKMNKTRLMCAYSAAKQTQCFPKEVSQ